MLCSELQNLSNSTSNSNTTNSNNSETASTGAQPQGTAPPKKKPSRRAKTAESRAAHNALERARRETLSSRFSDLAALLPNLAKIRQPSKSAIVNSSIAHVHASRRHRLLASRELRILKSESDALRRELNEWRDRAGLPRVEEAVRSEGFVMVLNGDFDNIPLSRPVAPGGAIDEDDSPFDGFDEDDDDFGAQTAVTIDEPDDLTSGNAAAILKNVAAVGTGPGFVNGGSNGSSGGMLQPHTISRCGGAGQIIAQRFPSASFENPVTPATYEPQAFGGQFFTSQQHTQSLLDSDKIPVWATALPNTTVAFQEHMQQRAMISSHVHRSPSTANHVQNCESLKRQQFLAMHQHPPSQRQHPFPIADTDDTASDMAMEREVRPRSGSTSTGYSPPPGHGSSLSAVVFDSPGNYESPLRYDGMGMAPPHMDMGLVGSAMGTTKHRMVSGYAGGIM